MPPKDCRRLDEERHRLPRWRDSGSDAHHEALPPSPSEPANDLPLSHDELLPEHRVLGQQRRA